MPSCGWPTRYIFFFPVLGPLGCFKNPLLAFPFVHSRWLHASNMAVSQCTSEASLWGANLLLGELIEYAMPTVSMKAMESLVTYASHRDGDRQPQETWLGGDIGDGARTLWAIVLEVSKCRRRQGQAGELMPGCFPVLARVHVVSRSPSRLLSWTSASCHPNPASQIPEILEPT